MVLLSAIFVGMVSCDKDRDTELEQTDTEFEQTDTEFEQITETYEGTLTLTNINPVSSQVLNSIAYSNVHLTVTKKSENKAVLSFIEDELLSGGIDIDGKEVVLYSEFSIQSSLLFLYAYYPSLNQTLYDRPDMGYGSFEYNTTLNNNTVTYTNNENGYTFTGTTTVQNADTEIEGNVVNQQINITFGDIIHFVGKTTE